MSAIRINIGKVFNCDRIMMHEAFERKNCGQGVQNAVWSESFSVVYNPEHSSLFRYRYARVCRPFDSGNFLPTLKVNRLPQQYPNTTYSQNHDIQSSTGWYFFDNRHAVITPCLHRLINSLSPLIGADEQRTHHIAYDSALPSIVTTQIARRCRPPHGVKLFYQDIDVTIHRCQNCDE